MSIFLMMSSINVILSLLLFYVAIVSLQKIADVAKSQLIAPIAILSVAMGVLHLISASGANDLDVDDTLEAAWRIIDMMTIVSLIRLTKLVQ